MSRVEAAVSVDTVEAGVAVLYVTKAPSAHRRTASPLAWDAGEFDADAPQLLHRIRGIRIGRV